jgi:hypothetical protein
MWWYVLRIPIGVALAFIVYFAIRGGLLSASALSVSDINPFGLAALAALVGLFSKQATDKLEETFKTMFRTAPGTGDDARGGKLTPPTIVSVDPPTFTVANSPAELTVVGTGFAPTMTATFNGNNRTMVFRDSQHIAVRLDAADAVAGTYSLQLTNPGSDPVSIDVTVTP